MNELKLRWIKLFNSANDQTKTTTKESIIEKGFEELISHYSEKHRFYHKIEHISACLTLLDEIKSNITDFANIEIAIWFHDVIYEPNKSNNEEKSAEYAKKFLESIDLAPSDIKKIEHLILLTKHPSSPVSNDEKYLLDIDLSILGATNEHFDNYELQIRKEYRLVPSFLYKRGRKKILKSFFNLDQIFQTEYFYNRFETQSRNNIIRALGNLKNSKIKGVRLD